MIVSLAFALALQGTVSSDAALAKMRLAVAGHKSVQGTFTFRSYEQTGSGRFAYVAPSSFLVQTGDVRVVSDGKQAFRFLDGEKYYVELDRAAQDLLKLPGFGLVLDGATPTVPAGEAKAETLNGEDALAVPIKETNTPDDFQGYVVLSTRTWLPLAVRAARSGKVTEEYLFQNVMLDAPTKPEDFSLVPPAGYQNLNGNTPSTPAPVPVPVPAPVPVPVPIPEPPVPVPVPAKPVTMAFRKTPGEWAAALPGSLTVSPEISNVKMGGKPYWTFTIQIKGPDGYDWTKAVVQAHVPAGWRKAVLIGKLRGGQLFGCEKKEDTQPDALSITVPAASGAVKGPFKFGFDWKPLRAPKG
ncbi:hypothetical protein BH11ARM2_BH11ARM2_35210 [soil metagenome]